MAYLPPQKRLKCDEDKPRDKPMTSASFDLVQDQLADKYKLARVKEFAIQGHPNGKVLGCGVEVHARPGDSRFRLRIYDRDRENNGKLRSYIEISWHTFLDMKDHEDCIKRYLSSSPLRRKKHIFRCNDFCLSVVPAYASGRDPAVELNKQHTRILMSQFTFNNMMSYEKTLKNEYAEYFRRRDEQKAFIDEIVNLMAYIGNEQRVSDYVKRPADWYQAGTVTTWRKFTEQVSKSRERARKRGRAISGRT